jgi:hypothetical protein
MKKKSDFVIKGHFLEKINVIWFRHVLGFFYVGPLLILELKENVELTLMLP